MEALLITEASDETILKQQLAFLDQSSRYILENMHQNIR